MSDDAVDVSNIDFALAAYREEGAWVVASLPAQATASMETLLASLRRLPGEAGVLGMVSVDEEFFLVVRTTPAGVRVFINDGFALLDWPLAAEGADAIGLEWDEDDLEEFEPVGNISILADFGLDADELTMLCEDEDLYPEDQMKAIAKRLGFSREFAEAMRTR